jgi:hypothetical protein
MSQRYIGGLIYNPPGGFSGYFDGSGDYLTFSSNTSMDFGTGNFTIEGWFLTGTKSVSVGASRTIIGNSGNSYTMQVYISTSGFMTFGNTGSTFLQGAADLADNAWHHFAISRSGTGSNQIGMWVDGFRVALGTNSQNYTSGTIYLGGFDNASGFWNGNISNIRVVKGTAVYDPTATTITVPNGPLQAITNTSLLTCAYGTFRDGSTNNFTITVNGNTAVSTQNPFPLTTLPNPALGNQGNGVYSMSQYQSLLSQNLWPAVDPYWRYVTLMLHGNGTNGAQNNTFLDSSTNNFTITRNGNTTQGTFSPYGSLWSNVGVPNGSNSITTTYPGLTGTGDYTVSFWIYLNSWTGGDNNGSDGGFVYIYGQGASHPTYPFAVRITKAGKVIVVDSVNFGPTWESTFDYAGSYNTANSIKLNTWNYIHIVRNSGTLSIYANGNLQLSVSQSSAMAASVTNGTINDGNGFDGYISNFRIATTAITNATPPTAPSSATGAVLLTCASNRFQDLTGTYTVTPAGSASVQRFSPFNPTAPYAAGTDGGSGYFDGTGDYIQAADSASLSFSGDFTCEGWFYYTGTAASLVPSILIDSGTSAVSAFEINNGSTYLQLAGQVTNNTISRTTFSGTVVPSGWTHIAYVRSSNVIRVYVNGVVSATTLSNSAATGRIRQVGEGRTSGLPFPGYISNFRLVGSAVYTSNFTPPTSPVTAITNTQLLCDFTNAGILDNAEMNNLETVGNAQISTAQSKFGGGSIAFDGTGDYLTFPANNTLQFGTGDFTIEFWTYLNSVTGFQMFIDNRNSTSSTAAYITIYSSGTSLIFYTTGNDRITATSALSTGAWLHIAVSKSSGSTKMFVNGSQVGSTYSDANSYLAASTPQYIASRVSAADFNLNGYIDDLRITKGYARYTANFTPQRSQWQDQ